MVETSGSRSGDGLRTSSLALAIAVLLPGCMLAHPELAQMPPAPSQRNLAMVGAAGSEILNDAIKAAEAKALVAERASDDARKAATEPKKRTEKQNLSQFADQKYREKTDALNELIRLENQRDIESMSPRAVRISASNNILFFAVGEARRLATSYATGQREAARWQSGLQMPVIAAAAVGAGLLLGNVGRTGTNAEQQAKDTLRTLGHIGIGVGAFTAVRDRLLPSNLPDIYLGGYRAMVCIISEERRFLSIDAFEQQALFETAYRDVTYQIAVTQAAIAAAQDESATKNAIAIALGHARVEQASATMAVALTQMRQYMAREAVFLVAVSNASASVVKRALVTNTDYTKLLEAFTAASAAQPPSPPADAEPQNTGATRVPTLAEQAARLDLLRRELERVTPNYSDSLARVSQCPTLVTAAN